MWAATTYGGATAGDPMTFKAQQAMIDNCAWVKKHGWVKRCFVYDNAIVSLGWCLLHSMRL
jgi:hypothetical protein